MTLTETTAGDVATPVSGLIESVGEDLVRQWCRRQCRQAVADDSAHAFEVASGED
jgi:hypothetical protein